MCEKNHQNQEKGSERPHKSAGLSPPQHAPSPAHPGAIAALDVGKLLVCGNSRQGEAAHTFGHADVGGIRVGARGGAAGILEASARLLVVLKVFADRVAACSFVAIHSAATVGHAGTVAVVILQVAAWFWAVHGLGASVCVAVRATIGTASAAVVGGSIPLGDAGGVACRANTADAFVFHAYVAAVRVPLARGIRGTKLSRLLLARNLTVLGPAQVQWVFVKLAVRRWAALSFFVVADESSHATSSPVRGQARGT